jgi:hypothetical protein
MSDDNFDNHVKIVAGNPQFLNHVSHSDLFHEIGWPLERRIFTPPSPHSTAFFP